jgi:DNA ligase-1
MRHIPLMRAFAELLDRLVLTPARNGKLDLLRIYLSTTPDPDRGWALAAIAGSLEFAGVKPALLRRLAEERMDPALFAMSYDYVGDLAETVALIWPMQPGANRTPSLAETVDALMSASRASAPAIVVRLMDAMDASERYALLKLVTGGLRIGAGARLVRQALAQLGGVEIAEIEEIWPGLHPPYGDLFDWIEGRAERPLPRAVAPFRPVMLAHALEETDRAKIALQDFAVEWKWDGIRVQAVCDGDTRRLYTRTGEDIGAAFPDVLEGLDVAGALDGELLVRTPDGALAAFNDLQQRLNRKTADRKLIERFPAFVRAYDLLLDGADDIRALPLRERRVRLEAAVRTSGSGRLDVSPLLEVATWEALDERRMQPPDALAEGVMLKRWDSPYLIGRPKGYWWKWKRDPYTVDCVLMYAQRGHGKRSSYYSDYTFGVWTDAGLTPVGTAYFGFTDEELLRLDKYVRDNTVERFGPVRAVAADRSKGLVLEIAFEGLARSSRHKSGVAMRFPRVRRIRWDKPAAEADRLESLEALLKGTGSAD